MLICVKIVHRGKKCAKLNHLYGRNNNTQNRKSKYNILCFSYHRLGALNGNFLFNSPFLGAFIGLYTVKMKNKKYRCPNFVVDYHIFSRLNTFCFNHTEVTDFPLHKRFYEKYTCAPLLLLE